MADFRQALAFLAVVLTCFLIYACGQFTYAQDDPVKQTVTFQAQKTAYAGMVTVIATRKGDDWVLEQAIPQPFTPADKCDDQADCEKFLDDLCEDAGHGGVDSQTVNLTKGVMCSGDCAQHGAVAFAVCNGAK